MSAETTTGSAAQQPGADGRLGKLLSDDAYRKIDQEVAKFPPDRKVSAVIAALTIAQDEHGWLPPELMQEVAAYLKVKATGVQQVASFYSMFNLQPVGKYKLAICTNLPCEMTGSERAAQHLKSRLGIDYRETTPDGMFTLVKSECMGACADGPVVLVNNKRMCMRMSAQKLDELLEELKR